MIDAADHLSNGAQTTNADANTGPKTSVPKAHHLQSNLKNELDQAESKFAVKARLRRRELTSSNNDELQFPRRLRGRTQLAQLEQNIEIKTKFRSSSLESALKRLKQSRDEALRTINEKRDHRPRTPVMERDKVTRASTSRSIETTEGIGSTSAALQANDSFAMDDACENNHQAILNDNVQSFPSPTPCKQGTDLSSMPECDPIAAGSDCDSCYESPPLISSAVAGIGMDSELLHGHSHEESLAIAVAVNEDEEFISAAFECEPEIKTPIYKNRRYQFYCAAITILLIAIVTSAIYAALKIKDSSATGPPSSAPTTEREREGIVDRLIAVVGESNLLNPTSAQARAADWLINKDPMALDVNADSLVQRYLLVLFYISTTEDSPWLSCNPPTSNKNDDCDYMRLTSGDPLGLSFANITWGRWLSAKHECEWAGVQCDEFNQTRNIDLSGQEIRGTFPTELALVPYLESITLFMNQFHGTLPSELASARHLLSIELHYNYFTGEIPPEWYTSVNFQRLNVAGNFITGTIPTEVGSLSALKGLFIQENNFEGEIPTEIGRLSSLGKVVSMNYSASNLF
jgi:hypothetical protein